MICDWSNRSTLQTYLDRSMKMVRDQKGINLISVIFILVIIASIAAFMFTISNVQRQTSSFSILSSRALFAAESGMQWAIHSALSTGDCSAFPDTFNLSGGAAVGYTVSTTCAFSLHTENPDTFRVYSLSALAEVGTVGNPTYISRTLRATITDAP